MSTAALFTLALASLESGTIASGTTVIDLELSDFQSGACTLQIDAIDWEGPPNSWDILFDADDAIGDTLLIDIDVYPNEGSCFVRSIDPTLYMCEALTLDRSRVTWDASLVVPPGQHDITVWSDGGQDVWQPIADLELDCGGCDTYGDFDGDGMVDINDLIVLLSMWGEEVAFTDYQYLDAFADSGSGDGVIDGADLAALQANWGPTCPE